MRLQITKTMAIKLLLENDHIEGIRYYETYRKHGGYRAAEKAFKMAKITPKIVL